ncbi:GDSL family lipase [Candidatus Francisella endociliophora]|uniref:GDSL family lipase n=1 Tax=Candidatus Francisella endociliophora TaxID=653937 RepID=A0A097EM77_9GAMM|nr:arylesterase [Francisella sp. FSC1006]AIT08671.1 GDSL family lipase [Francisella sp. FSC1006]
MKKIIVVFFTVLVLYFGYNTLFGSNINNWNIVNSKPQGQTIVAFGDSLTAGYGVDKAENYPALLSKMINQPVINMGISGETTAQALQRVNSVIAQDPKIVLITLGGNDLKKNTPASEAFYNLKEIVDKLQDHGALVVIGGIDFPYYSKDYADDYIKFAKDNGCLLVPNILDGLFGHSDLMVDRVHPNAKGYTIVATMFNNVLKNYL